MGCRRNTGDAAETDAALGICRTVRHRPDRLTGAALLFRFSTAPSSDPNRSLPGQRAGAGRGAVGEERGSPSQHPVAALLSCLPAADDFSPQYQYLSCGLRASHALFGCFGAGILDARIRPERRAPEANPLAPPASEWNQRGYRRPSGLCPANLDAQGNHGAGLERCRPDPHGSDDWRQSPFLQRRQRRERDSAYRIVRQPGSGCRSGNVRRLHWSGIFREHFWFSEKGPSHCSCRSWAFRSSI